jgi:SecD/SecF fusion protein
MSMNADDARKWKFLTNECAPHMNQPGRAIAICLDDIVFSAPVVQGTIEGGRSEINGSFTEKEANELVDALRAGTLPFDLNAIRIEEMK